MTSTYHIFTLLTNVAFVLSGLFALLLFARQNDRIWHDTVLMFGALMTATGMQFLNAILREPNSLLMSFGSILLVTQPYLMLRLIRHFRSVSTRIQQTGMAGLIASWIVLLIGIADQPVIVTVFIVLYIIVINGYAMWLLIQGAEQIPVGGHNNQHAFKLERRDDYIKLQQEITLAADTATTIDEPLSKAVQLICQMFNWPVGHVFAPAEEAPIKLQSTTIWYLDAPEKYRKFREVTENLTFIVNLGGVGHAIAEGHPCWFTNIAQRADYIRAATARSVGIQTGVFIPILSRQKAVAVLEFYSDQLLEPDQELLDFLAQIGTQLGRIIERKQANLLIQESETRFRSLFDSAPTGIVIADRDGIIQMLNERAVDMFGHMPSEVIGERLEVLLPEHLRQIHVVHREGYIAAPQTRPMGVGMNLVGLRKDGNEFPVEVGLSTIELGEETLSVGFISDISKRVSALEALGERENTLALALRAAGAGTWSWDITSGHIIWDEATERLHGLEAGAFSGKYEDWRSRIHPDDIDAAEQSVRLALKAEAPFNTQFRVIWPDADGSVRHLLGQGIVLRDENGEAIRMIGVNIDITERKQAEMALRSLNAELESRVRERTAHLTAINKELEAFSYSVSHDLRAPLRAVDGFSLALLEDYYDVLDDTGRDFLNRIRRESQRMGHLIDDLIELSRYSRSQMEMKAVNLSDLAQNILTELQSDDPERTIDVSIEEDMIVCADEPLIRVALSNLLGNAWKFTTKEDQPKIEVGCQQDNGTTEYFVRDNGAGFNMAYVNKLFGAFQRLHAMDEFYGTGIGLATVQRIIHRHGGTVRAEGVVDEGATFYFTLAEGGC